MVSRLYIVVMNSAQVVVMGDKVYIGGGHTESIENRKQVFQYDPSRNGWSHLPPHHLVVFAMVQFKGNLITVGGGIPDGGITGKVYRFIEESQKWEEFLKPMPTAKAGPSVATTQSAIVTSGEVMVSLISGMARPCPVTLWRCTAVKTLSGTMLTHYLYLVWA